MSYLVLWIITGIILLIAEMLTGTFILIFISLGCFVAALVALLLPASLATQIFICAIISLVGAFVLRKPLQRKLLKTSALENDIGKEIIIDQNILTHQQVRIAYQGTTWEATNIGTEDIHKGDRVTIVGHDATILLLRKN